MWNLLSGTPAIGDTIVVAGRVSSDFFLTPTSKRSDPNVIINVNNSFDKGSLIPDWLADSYYAWLVVASTTDIAGHFRLQSRANSSYYLYVSSSKTYCSSPGTASKANMQIRDNCLYNDNSSKYLEIATDGYDYYWGLNSSEPTYKTILYRKEHYIHFCTSIEAAASPCPNCFIFTP